jgi:hypothetical protein
MISAPTMIASPVGIHSSSMTASGSAISASSTRPTFRRNDLSVQKPEINSATTRNAPTPTTHHNSVLI